MESKSSALTVVILLAIILAFAVLSGWATRPSALTKMAECLQGYETRRAEANSNDMSQALQDVHEQDGPAMIAAYQMHLNETNRQIDHDERLICNWR